jgi:hypothetical protein
MKECANGRCRNRFDEPGCVCPECRRKRADQLAWKNRPYNVAEESAVGSGRSVAFDESNGEGEE